MNSKIWLSSPHMSGFEQQYIQQAFDEKTVLRVGYALENVLK